MSLICSCAPALGLRRKPDEPRRGRFAVDAAASALDFGGRHRGGGGAVTGVFHARYLRREPGPLSGHPGCTGRGPAGAAASAQLRGCPRRTATRRAVDAGGDGSACIRANALVHLELAVNPGTADGLRPDAAPRPAAAAVAIAPALGTATYVP